MSMIKGKIETVREIAPREITFGKSPIHRNSSGEWVSNDPEFDVRVTNIGTLMDELLKQESVEESYKKSAHSSELRPSGKLEKFNMTQSIAEGEVE